MKIASICLTILLFIITSASIYEIFEAAYIWDSPLIPHQVVVEMQKSYMIHTAIVLVFFLLSLYVTIKRETLASFKTVGGIVLGYILTIFVLSFIIVNG